MTRSGWCSLRTASRPWLVFAALLLAMPSSAAPALARGPASVADVAEGLQDTVVNISTTQTLKGNKEESPIGPGPKGSPFEEFFKRFKTVELTGPAERLRSNFIGGIKHLPVEVSG